jgi:hypothetical protein
VRALELLARHLNMLPERHEHRHRGAVPVAPVAPPPTQRKSYTVDDLDLPLPVAEALLDAVLAKEERDRQASAAPGGIRPPDGQPLPGGGGRESCASPAGAAACGT